MALRLGRRHRVDLVHPTTWSQDLGYGVFPPSVRRDALELERRVELHGCGFGVRQTRPGV